MKDISIFMFNPQPEPPGDRFGLFAEPATQAQAGGTRTKTGFDVATNVQY